MNYKYLILFGQYLILSQQFIIDNSCNKNLDKIVINYFKNINCVTQVSLTEKLVDFSKIQIPKFTKKVNVQNLQYTNLTYRPRRDIFDKERNIEKFCPENNQGFIIISNLENFSKLIHTNTITPFWSGQALFFIYFTDFDEIVIGNFFENIWRIFRSPHLVATGCTGEIIKYYPFIYNNKWGDTFKYDLNQVLEQPDLILNDLKNLNGYPLKPLVFRSPLSIPGPKNKYYGLDIFLMELTAGFINFTTEILEPFDDLQYGFKLDDGNFTGGLHRLLKGDADYINVDYFITDYLTRDIEFSASTMSDSLCIIMRKAEKIPDWQLLYYCFDKTMWIALLIIYFVMSISWVVIQKILFIFNEEAVVYPFVFTDTFRLMITSSLFRLPTITSERVFLATCLISFVTIVGAFQGSLVGVFSAQLFYKDVNTLDELSWTPTQIKSGYLFLIGEVFTDVTNPKILRLKNMLGYYNDSVVITKRVAEQQNFATLVRRSEFDLDKATTTYFDSEGNDLIHMVKECARSYNLAYPVPVNWYLAPRFADVLLRSAQAGLYTKWYNEMAFDVLRTKRQASVTDGFKIFSLKDMQIAFYIFVMGISVSVFVFLIEIFVKKCVNKETT